MSGAHWFLLFFAVLSVYNCGVIWPTQRVTYPLFQLVPEAQFRAYHLFYNRRITAVVVVPGFLSFLAPFLLTAFRPPTVPLTLAVLSAALGGVALLTTAGLEIPRHIRLQREGKTDRLLRELIVYNWLRTAAISAQALLVLWLLRLSFVPVAT